VQAGVTNVHFCGPPKHKGALFRPLVVSQWGSGGYPQPPEVCVFITAVGPVKNPVLLHRVRLFSLVPLVWESNPKLQGGWCKTQPPGR
jgi:hypothetical protein